MTILAEPTTTAPPDQARPSDVSDAAPPEDATEREPIRPVPLAIAWALITVVGVAVVLMAVGPISAERDQRALLTAYRVEIESASNQAFGLGGIEVPTEAPALGTPVGILDIESIGLSQVIVEGTQPEQTRQGPGHVVGTGGPGQPGNSVVVGRRALFGGAFGDLDTIRRGDEILVSTSQGRTLYRVEHVGIHAVEASSGSESASATTSTTTTAPDGVDAIDLNQIEAATDGSPDPASDEGDGILPDGTVKAEQLYGPSPDDRLTLVTTATGTPGGAGEALVVVAVMDGQAFPPTPQGGRTPGNDGRSGASDSWAALTLAVLAYLVTVVATIWLHRNVPWRSAYLLTAPVLVALTIVLADELASVLPAWS